MRAIKHSGVAFKDPLRLFDRIKTKLHTIWVRLAYPFAALGEGVSFHHTCDLRNTALMQLGDYLIVHKDVWLHAQLAGDTGGDPALIIDDHCFIGRRSHISAKNHIHIERGVMLAASVLIEDNSHRFEDVSLPIRYQGTTRGGRIHIGSGCWIGQGAVILCDKGELTLGRNCVVAANAVVTRSAPPYSVLAGNPARIVKHYDPAKGAWVLGASAHAETVGFAVVVR
jgi:acetyltransferase-like isoleucine patch superfamily enzyme